EPPAHPGARCRQAGEAGPPPAQPGPAHHQQPAYPPDQPGPFRRPERLTAGRRPRPAAARCAGAVRRLRSVQRSRPRAPAPGAVRPGLGYQRSRPRPAELPAMTLRACLLALSLGLSLPLQAATELIQLNYRTAEDVLPVVQSTLDGQGKVSPYGNQLVINASPEKIQEVRDLLQQLDTAPRRLLISVDTSESSLQDRDGYRVDGSARAGDVEVIAGRGEVHGRDQVRILRRSTDSRSGGTQQVQATEGYPALIQVGQSVPLTSTSVGPYGQVYQNTQYHSVNQGFYVTAN